MTDTKGWDSGWFAMFRKIVLLIIACFFAQAFSNGLEFESTGGADFLYFLTQNNHYTTLPPGYRFDFSIDNLLYEFSNGHAFLNVANSTWISRHDTTLVQLDKINYKLEPGFRMPGSRYESNVLLSHECFHYIDRTRNGGSVFWNTAEFNWGTRGAYDHNLVARVIDRDFQMRNSWDFEATLDAFFFGHEIYWIQQNENYRGHVQGLIRYNWALWKHSAFYADVREDAWVDVQGKFQQKGQVQWNWILLSQKSIGTLYVEYTYLDQNPYDNENSLVGVGFRIEH